MLCEDEKGVKYIVEMQVAKVGGFEKRAQYYAARTYSRQMESGEKYEELKEVIFLAITEYTMFPKKEGYKSDHWILDKKTYERDLKDFSFTFIELPKFNKKLEELKSDEDKWCYFFKHADDPKDVAELLANSDEVIKKAYEELKTHHWTKQELISYEAAEKIARDNRAREAFIKDEAREEGLKEGIKEGIEKGRQEGIEKVAVNMLTEGFDVKIVSKSTGLSEGEVERLKN